MSEDERRWENWSNIWLPLRKIITIDNQLFFCFVTIFSLMNSFYLLLMIELKWEEPKEDELRKFLVERMGFNPDRVTTGIAKLQTAHRKKSQKRMDRYFNLFYFTFFYIFFFFSFSFCPFFLLRSLLSIWHKILKVYLLTIFSFFYIAFFSFFPFFFIFSIFPFFKLYS